MIRLSVARASKKNKVLGAELVAPGEEKTSGWLRPNDPLPPGPFALFPSKSAEVDLDKGVAWANAIDVDSVFIVRRSLTEQIFAPLVEAGEVVLRPAHVYRAHPSKKLAWKKGILDDDFVFVDVRARFPADRAKQEASAFGGAPPYSSILRWVPSHDFGDDRAPRFSLFRVGDESSVLLASDSLFAALKRALGPAIREGGSGPRFFLLDASSSPPIPASADAGAAAADAFYRMYRTGKSRKADREAALASPIWAYWLALVVDRAPADDTRAAACRHPHFAYAYARDVDGGAHALTRKAVAKDKAAATEYAVHVDHAVHPSLRDALSYHAPDVEIRAHENAKRFAAKADSPPRPAEHQRLVFAPDGRGVVLGRLHVEGGELYAPFHPRAPGVGRFIADEYGGKGRLRRQKSLAHLGALRNGNFGPLIVRKSAVAPVLAALGDEVELLPCALHDDDGELDDDFAILDVKTYVVMDPIASDVKLAHAKAPWTGGVNLVHRFAWSASSVPRARIFRIRELPWLVLADPALCAALAKATGRAVRGSNDPPTPEEMTALVAPPKKAPADEKQAAAAMAAFHAGDRKGALAHPLGALAVALAERKPSADTRKAALSSPRIALEYALFVDRVARPDTRAAAAKTPDTAYRYARHLDLDRARARARAD